MTNAELADICEAMENAIQDVQVEFESYIDPPITEEELVGTGKATSKGPARYKWATARPFADRSYSSEQVTFLNEYGDSWKGIDRQSYNGKTGRLLSVTEKPGQDLPVAEGVITKSKRFILHETATPQNYTVLRFMQNPYNYPLSKALRNDEWVEIDERIKVINGFSTIRVTLFVMDLVDANDQKVPCLNILFSVNHGYTPVKFQDINGGKPGFSVDVTELTEVSIGLWFPKSGQMIWPADKRRSPECRTQLYKASSIEINQGLPDDFFNIDFPPGTRVVDETLSLEYVVKPSE